MDHFLFSKFTQQLKFEEKKAYIDNLATVGICVDPYDIPDNKFVHWNDACIVENLGHWPPLAYMDCLII